METLEAAAKVDRFSITYFLYSSRRDSGNIAKDSIIVCGEIVWLAFISDSSLLLRSENQSSSVEILLLTGLRGGGDTQSKDRSIYEGKECISDIDTMVISKNK